MIAAGQQSQHQRNRSHVCLGPGADVATLAVAIEPDACDSSVIRVLAADRIPLGWSLLGAVW